MAPADRLLAILDRVLDADTRAWLAGARAQVAEGADAERLAALFSLASRHVKERPLGATDAERGALRADLRGLELERWTRLEAARATLVLARPDLAAPAGAAAVEELFRYADEGEQRAAYKTLALLPDPGRFAWRGGEGARSNMRSVFEAACCDTPFPVDHFDDVAWRQCVVKAIFVEAPLYRVFGLDTRLSEELARMALDLADERRSAGRPVNPQLWLCLGAHGGERAAASIEEELASPNPVARAAAALALGRAGDDARLARLEQEERVPEVRSAVRIAREGRASQEAFRDLDLAAWQARAR